MAPHPPSKLEEEGYGSKKEEKDSQMLQKIFICFFKNGKYNKTKKKNQERRHQGNKLDYQKIERRLK